MIEHVHIMTGFCQVSDCNFEPCSLQLPENGSTVDSRYSGPLKYGHLDIPAIWFWHGMLARCLLHKTHPEVTATRYSVYWPVLAALNKVFNVILCVYYGPI